MTTADDLPPIPWAHYQWMYWTEKEMQENIRAYALAARAERDEKIRELEDEVNKYARLDRFESRHRAETAEARVKELEHQLEIAQHDSVSQSRSPDPSAPATGAAQGVEGRTTS